MKHEIDMCCGTTCDKALNAEYVKNLELERDELTANQNRLRGELEYFIRRVEEGSIRSKTTYQRYQTALAEVPEVSLAEVKAQAVDDAAHWLATQYPHLSHPSGGLLTYRAYRIREEDE